MGPRVYVGGLSVPTTDRQLGELCAPYGTVKSACVIGSKITGRSFGYGFVEMASPAEALEAILALDGTELNGETLRAYLTS